MTQPADPKLESIPLSSPAIGDDEAVAVERVLRSGQLSMGNELHQFENELGAYLGGTEAVGVTNGTAGLHLCIVDQKIGPGDEVITTPFSFVASSNCILFEKAQPVFVDIEPDTLNIDPELISSAITPRTRAILVVHVFGKPANMDRIMAIARTHSLAVIEDACEGIGAEFNGRRLGTFGDAGVFSFYPNKQMTLGEGGAVVTNDPSRAENFRSLRNQGRDNSSEWLEHSQLGYNYRLDEIRAALGLVQLRRLDHMLGQREQIAKWYTERLQEVDGVTVPIDPAGTTRASWFVYVVRLEPESLRDLVMKELQTRGIQSRVYFPPIHLQPFYRKQFGYGRGDFPITEAAGDSCLALPFSSLMSEEQVDHVCRELQLVVGQTS